MKNYLILFVLVSFTFWSHAQNYFNFAARISNSTGEEIIHPEMDQYAIAAYDGEIATFVNVYVSASNSYHMKMLELDNNGNKNWEGQIPDFIGKQIIASDDGNFLIIGFHLVNGNYLLEIIKISRSSGTEIWRNQFPGISSNITSIDDPALIIRTAETNEHYIGIIETSMYFGEIIAFKIDDIGLVNWMYRYEVAVKAPYWHLSAVTNRIGNNGILVGFYGINLMFYAIDYNGNEVKTINISGFNYNHNLVLNRASIRRIGDSYIIGFNILDDNSLYISNFNESSIIATYQLSSSDLETIQPTSIFYSGSNSSIDLLAYTQYTSNLFKFNSFISLDYTTGVPNIYKKYIAKNPTDWINVSSMVQNLNNGYYMKGLSEFSINENEKDLQIISVDGMGEVECSYDINYNELAVVGEYYEHDLEKIPVIDYPIYIFPTGVGTWQFTMLDVCESVIPDPIDKKGIDENRLDEQNDDSQLMLYPNPAENYLNLVAEEQFKTVEIYDYTGKLVYSKEVNSSFVRIATEDLTSGLYFVKIISQNEPIVKTISIK